MREHEVHKRDQHLKAHCRKPAYAMDISDELIFCLLDLNRTMHSLYEGKCSQKRILMILNETGCITQRELTECLGIQPGSASEIIAKLETAGYIMRTTSQEDRRTMNIELTGEGKRAALDALEQRKKRHKEMFSCLSEEEKSRLLSLLEIVKADWRKRYYEERKMH